MHSENVPLLFKVLDQHPEWQVLDVGAHEQPLLRADWAIDLLPIHTAGSQRAIEDHIKGRPYDCRISEERWVTKDICSSQWPFMDHQFDFAVCSNVLEDVRDPVFVVSELRRVAKAGYIECPRPGREIKTGVDENKPDSPGYWHHRWFVSYQDGGLEFLPKFASLDVRELPDAPDGFEPIFWRSWINAWEIVPQSYAGYIKALRQILGVRDV